jgi:hypothetical protein
MTFPFPWAVNKMVSQKLFGKRLNDRRHKKINIKVYIC